MKNKISIGIDPDCDKSGFSLINGEHYELQTLTFFDIFKRFKELILLHGTECITVYIECGFLNKSNWHKIVNQSANVNAKIGERTGANFEVAKKLCEMCEYLGLKYIQVRPTRRKLDASTFKSITKINQRTNQEMRDSFMLIFGR
ncbi:hypothetical protein MG290_01770 [Flavobacterium sp. CBA20B-1]|uniref:hypothetical protein n=1 Tax=unclassified Flavobacterium TaxID=196869 RepID=UPI0022247B46|nr:MULTISPECIES: hypothetical protein [unclassified Flavobacterium]WCM42423.1 hypothetical protein MG290_01770 [Flavobacterium sp. CBA20B-1]